ncbi:unnamed protein product [Phytophthora lilii]|uniref:Unnamed protein product n=1 Tax=Phytophthora lilii TaxID=2077276 RepID=A0A9W6X0X8_9STRA|nr:unnamed protein product [Phytophthora lilii]
MKRRGLRSRAGLMARPVFMANPMAMVLTKAPTAGGTALRPMGRLCSSNSAKMPRINHERGDVDLVEDVERHLLPRQQLEQRQCGHGRVEVCTGDASADGDPEEEGQPPAQSDGDEAAAGLAAEHDLRHAGEPEEHGNEGGDERGHHLLGELALHHLRNMRHGCVVLIAVEVDVGVVNVLLSVGGAGHRVGAWSLDEKVGNWTWVPEGKGEVRSQREQNIEVSSVFSGGKKTVEQYQGHVLQRW